MSELANGIVIEFSDEGEIIIRYPEGIVDRTGIVPSSGERLIMEAFGGTTVGKSLLKRLREKEIHDPLTGLLRRDPGRKIVEERLDRISRVPFDGSISVLVMDLDFFGMVNKTYGQTAGDQVLAWFAGILKRWLRGSDVVIRWGGEEFVIFTSASNMPIGRESPRDRDAKTTPAYQRTGATGENLHAVMNNGEIVGNRIIHSLEAGPCTVGGIAIHQRVTIGIATQLVIPGMDLEGTFDRLFELADKELRTAKTDDKRGKIHSAPLHSNP